MENKKNEDKRIERKMPLFYLVGLNIALFLTIAAFEWTTGPEKIDVFPQSEDPYKEMDIIPFTEIKPPPPPKPKEIIVKEVLEEPEEVLEDLIIDTELDPEDKIPVFEFEPDDIEVVEEAPITLAEVMPSFPGGFEAFYKFISTKIKYPSQARRMGIEGKVYLQFVVEKDGSIGKLIVAKGVGAGLDEESLRVMNMVPNFNPGKQRGKPVRVRMTIPINFRLSN